MKRELIFLLSITRDYVVSVRRGFLFLVVLRTGWLILLLHSLGLPNKYFIIFVICANYVIIGMNHNLTLVNRSKRMKLLKRIFLKGMASKQLFFFFFLYQNITYQTTCLQNIVLN